MQADAVLISRLRKYPLGGITELLHADDECAAGEGGGMNAEAGVHLAGVDALPPGASATQRNRLLCETMSIMEVVQQQRDRDLLQLSELEDASEWPTHGSHRFARHPESSRSKGVQAHGRILAHSVPSRADTALRALMISYSCYLIETLLNLYCQVPWGRFQAST